MLPVLENVRFALRAYRAYKNLITGDIAEGASTEQRLGRMCF